MNKIINFAVTLICVVISCFLGYYLAENIPKKNLEADNSISRKVDFEKFPYLIKDYEEKLAVFTDENDVPDIVFELYLNQLPDLDREQIKKGIYVESYDKLIALIEDYTS